MAGTLSLFVGADPRAIAPFRTLLGTVADQIFTMGGAGKGYIAKLCQLHLNYISAVGVCEVHNLARDGGLDLGTLSRALNASCSASYVVENYLPKIMDGSFDPTFSLGLAAKDTHLIASMVQDLSADAPLAEKTAAVYQVAVTELGAASAHLAVAKSLAGTGTPGARRPVTARSGAIPA